MNTVIPDILIRAQEFQKAGDYPNTCKLYKKFWE